MCSSPYTPATTELTIIKPHFKQMDRQQKDKIRLLIIERLYDESTHVILNELCYNEGIEDMFSAREFFEEQVERINKLFNYPEIRLED